MLIRLRFHKGRSAISNIICMFTWSEWSHLDFVLDDGLLGATLENGNGVQVRPFNYANPVKYQYASVEVSDEVGKKVIEFARAQIGKKYDLGAIFGIVTHSDLTNDKEKWFCSELVAAAFAAANFPLLNMKYYHRITPEDLASSPFIEFEEKVLLK